MKHLHIDPSPGFTILAASPRSEAATMVLEPGGSTGGPDNTHRADQWLFVVSGTGQATVGAHRVRLEAGDLVLIEAEEPHEIVNTGQQPLKTLNIYAPPEF